MPSRGDRGRRRRSRVGESVDRAIAGIDEIHVALSEATPISLSQAAKRIRSLHSVDYSAMTLEENHNLVLKVANGPLPVAACLELRQGDCEWRLAKCLLLLCCVILEERESDSLGEGGGESVDLGRSADADADADSGSIETDVCDSAACLSGLLDDLDSLGREAACAMPLTASDDRGADQDAQIARFVSTAARILCLRVDMTSQDTEQSLRRLESRAAVFGGWNEILGKQSGEISDSGLTNIALVFSCICYHRWWRVAVGTMFRLPPRFRSRGRGGCTFEAATMDCLFGEELDAMRDVEERAAAALSTFVGEADEEAYSAFIETIQLRLCMLPVDLCAHKASDPPFLACLPDMPSRTSIRRANLIVSSRQSAMTMARSEGGLQSLLRSSIGVEGQDSGDDGDDGDANRYVVQATTDAVVLGLLVAFAVSVRGLKQRDAVSKVLILPRSEQLLYDMKLRSDGGSRSRSREGSRKRGSPGGARITLMGASPKSTGTADDYAGAAAEGGEEGEQGSPPPPPPIGRWCLLSEDGTRTAAGTALQTSARWMIASGLLSPASHREL